MILNHLQSYLYNPYTFRCANTRYGLFFTVNRIIRSFNKKDLKVLDSLTSKIPIQSKRSFFFICNQLYLLRVSRAYNCIIYLYSDKINNILKLYL